MTARSMGMDADLYIIQGGDGPSCVAITVNDLAVDAEAVVTF